MESKGTRINQVSEVPYLCITLKVTHLMKMITVCSAGVLGDLGVRGVLQEDVNQAHASKLTLAIMSCCSSFSVDIL